MIRLKSNTVQAYMDSISRLGGLVKNYGRWHHSELPRQMGKGAWEYYHLQPGIELTISRYCFDQPARVDFIHDQPMFCFGCLLEGGFDLRGRRPRCAISLRHGQGMNMWTSQGEYVFRLAAGRYVGVQLVVDPEVLQAKLGEADLLPPALRRVSAQRSLPVQISANPLSAAAYKASSQILSVSSDDPLRMLRLESLGLIILREQLDTLTAPTDGMWISRRDRDRVQAVRDFLTHHPEQSPRLSQLAHMVGMNEFSMTRSFRVQFGQTIYEYLRRQRMEIADHLLAEGEHSITEIARAVGYQSLGRFSAAFRRQFGVTPKKHQMSLSNRKSESDPRN